MNLNRLWSSPSDHHRVDKVQVDVTGGRTVRPGKGLIWKQR